MTAAAGCGSEAQTQTTGAGAGTTTNGGTGGEGGGDGGAGASTTTSAGGTTGSGGATTTTTGTGTTSSSTTSSSTTTTTPPPGVLRFIALGDGGEGNDTQYKVAEVAKNLCALKGGCEFALYLGDNIYDSGVSGTDDSQFQTKFEMPYANVPFPFYVVLGNHDYGGGGAGFEFWKAEAQVDYTNLSTKWTMPERFYSFLSPLDVGPQNGPKAIFIGLDTNAIMYSGDGDQQAWLEAQMAQAPAGGWKIGFGHHPYVSNGAHGNAGEYEGIPGIPVVSGGNVKDFFDDSVCGKIDLYISGHDHNRQWLEPACGTEYIVSGTAAKHTDLEPKGTPTFFENDQTGGFLYVELTDETFTGTFYDENGIEEFSRTVGK